MDFNTIFNTFSNVKVAVIGDVMLDTYWWGNVNRISPEAPVPIVALQKNELRLGGAANVALNLIALGANTAIISVIGTDVEGNKLQTLLQEEKINTNYIIASDNRITTNKTRILSRNQQMMRLDAEMTVDLTTALEDKLLQNIKQYIITEKPAIIIFEDYNKGVLTERVITQTISLCKQYNVLTSVDPKRKNFFSYKNVDLFKPNLIEVKEALNMLFDDVTKDVLTNIHQQLQLQLNHHISFITLSEKGVFYNVANDCYIIPTHIRNIADVSGAGDTVIAVASLVYAATQNIQLAAEMANIAGGLVCEEVGTAAINKEKLLTECEKLITKLYPLN
ncbi:MAG: bifunctional heptose 7-phosphate kinase/heptose 1-phosphate adenyltransferase [Chitinophagaceae bacterium]